MILVLAAALALQTAPPDPARADHGPDGDDETVRPAPLVDYAAAGRAAVEARLAVRPNTGRAQNAIVFIADGMDITTTTAARILDGQRRGEPGEENVLAFEALPHTALAKTYNTDAQVPDSAGTATAILSGRKTRAGVVNVDQTVERGDCEGAEGKRLDTLGDLAASLGKSVGVVTTARITHATPASLYASSPDRDWESDADLPEGVRCPDIARQLISRRDELNLAVAFGGGRQAFTTEGKRRDGRDLLSEWARSGEVVLDAEGFAALDPMASAPVLGLFADSHLAYEADRTDAEPSLADMTRFAIEKLAEDREGYVLLVEGGRVDHAHHGGNAARALFDVIAFDEAVETALSLTDSDETLIVVTADHGHTLTFQGYPRRGNPVLGIVKPVGSTGGEASKASDGQTYTTLGYANGPGAPHLVGKPSPRPGPSDDEAQDVDYRQQSAVPAFSETHGGQDVIVYAGGPGAWLVGGVLEQNVLYHVVRHALTTASDDPKTP